MTVPIREVCIYSKNYTIYSIFTSRIQNYSVPTQKTINHHYQNTLIQNFNFIRTTQLGTLQKQLSQRYVGKMYDSKLHLKIKIQDDKGKFKKKHFFFFG